MNSTETETPERVNVEEQARTVLLLLREYTEKMLLLGNELVTFLHNCQIQLAKLDVSQAAWLLDQSELIRKPLLNVLSRATGLHENSAVSHLTEDELALRRLEIEIHLHHVIRQTGELRTMLDGVKKSQDVAKLRLAAGLNAMKGGPLRPE